ncbi:MAG: hypothetical protein K2X81_09365 [Candidatus Obscuribacterales bacterium]|nr:hypothetical protein [Candidatus Obscuribacterales bacterium]
MDKLQPKSLTVEGENSYKVCFQMENGEVEYIFTMETSPFPFLVCEREFLEITNGDPAADRLKESICVFHETRHFAYAQPKISPAAEIRGSQLDTDASKRASA